MSRVIYRFVSLSDDDYLEDMQLRLGTFFDTGVNQCGLDGQYVAEIFIDSGIARKFELRTPKYVAGLTGTELLERAFEACSMEVDVPNSPRWPTSPDYWVGYTLPCFQVSTGIPYKRLFDVLNYDDLRGMHYRYQERDEDEFVQGVLELLKNRRPENPLRRIRKASDLTQSQLAKAAGVSLRSIQLYEQGAKDLNRAAIDTVRRLSSVLCCDVEDLLPIV